MTTGGPSPWPEPKIDAIPDTYAAAIGAEVLGVGTRVPVVYPFVGTCWLIFCQVKLLFSCWLGDAEEASASLPIASKFQDWTLH